MIIFILSTVVILTIVSFIVSTNFFRQLSVIEIFRCVAIFPRQSELDSVIVPGGRYNYPPAGFVNTRVNIVIKDFFQHFSKNLFTRFHRVLVVVQIPWKLKSDVKSDIERLPGQTRSHPVGETVKHGHTQWVKRSKTVIPGGVTV